VQVAAFLVTARLGAQDTREAFTDVVLEQLAELLGQDLPSLTATTRDAHLLGMLEQAAEACAAQDERLILVVSTGWMRIAASPPGRTRTASPRCCRATLRPGCGSWSPGGPTPDPGRPRLAPAA
jgi:hypothetical protein